MFRAWCFLSQRGTVLSSRNPVERLIEVAIVIVTLGFAVYLLGWALWLWWLAAGGAVLATRNGTISAISMTVADKGEHEGAERLANAMRHHLSVPDGCTHHHISIVCWVTDGVGALFTSKAVATTSIAIR
jgi:hypothetical protein